LKRHPAESRKAVIEITAELLFQLMPFPKYTKVLGWHVSDQEFMKDTLLLKVQHKSLKPILNGCHIEKINPQFKRLKNGRIRFVKWGYANE